jgi:BASS family bile acid:Na+ symporter
MFDSYAQYEYLLAQVQLVLFMMGMGATLAGADFLRISRQPRYLLTGAVCQFLLTPLLAVLVNCWPGLEPGIAVGLVLISAMPGGPLSKVFTYLGRGNLALSITLTFFGTLASVVTVPLLLRLLAAEYAPAEMQMPVGRVVRDVCLYLLLPLGVGMAVSHLAPARRHPFSKWCIRIGFVFVVAMVVGSLGSGRIHPGEYGWRAPIAITVFCLLAQQASLLPFRLLRWPVPDRLAVGIEVTMRNINLALLLKALLFPAAAEGAREVADGVLFALLFYAGVALCAGLPLAWRHRRIMARSGKGPGASLG